MGTAIGQSLPLAIGVALGPVPVIAVVLMLTTPQARANGPAFALGWPAGLGWSVRSCWRSPDLAGPATPASQQPG